MAKPAGYFTVRDTPHIIRQPLLIIYKTKTVQITNRLVCSFQDAPFSLIYRDPSRNIGSIPLLLKEIPSQSAKFS